ncbi:O-fucosyltransferase 23 [Stylosanthes scabra]|uniref:O-fucosyltransferase family protein n=1 Tax=Stylosanthes scabra TaxID=79078 RepID=A0ABU6YEE2_9FABA|nr:O-fucosyltransferase 23 [Stylosanthes scabra]
MGGNRNSIAFKCVFVLVAVLILRALLLPSIPGIVSRVEWGNIAYIRNDSQESRFLEVPQIVWGLNNQKIAFARACLTARMLNRTLLMPSLSASLFYKEVDLLQPISFDKVFQFQKFNELCNGFVQLGRYSDLSNRTRVLELQKGSGRKWTLERDLEQLREHGKGSSFENYEVIKIIGKNPFLWHDHWPVKDYAKVFECLVLVEEFAKEADRVVSKIRGEVGSSLKPLPYVAVHMRVEIDWMIHCKKLEQRLNTNQICSSKDEIIERVASIPGLETPAVVYLAVADKLLRNSSVLEGWGEGFLPFEKKKLGVEGIYSKYPYLIQSAIDYEVCLRADIFVGNSFSTFSSLIVLERTQKMIKKGESESNKTWPSYAYNIKGESNGPKRWITNMSDLSLQAISYGTTHISS